MALKQARPGSWPRWRTRDLRDRIASDRRVGAMLRALRKAKGIQAKFVSTALQIAPGYLSDLEAGNRHWNDEREKAYLKAIGEL